MSAMRRIVPSAESYPLRGLDSFQGGDKVDGNILLQGNRKYLLRHFIDTLLIVFVHTTQGVIMDIFLTSHFQVQVLRYTLPAINLIVTIAFILSSINTWGKFQSASPASPAPSAHNSSIPRIFQVPLYIAWMLYATLIVTKVIVLTKIGVMAYLERQNEDYWFETLSNLKLSIAATALVFIFLVALHFGPAKPHYHAADGSTHSTFSSVVGVDALEILDTVDFMSVLFVGESKIKLPGSLEDIVLVLASANLMLPTLSVWGICLCGETPGLVQQRFKLGIALHTLRFLLINLPYFGIRFYLWQIYTHSGISVFVMKNLVGLCMSLRTLITEYRELFKQLKSMTVSKNQNQINELEMNHMRT